MKNLNLKMNRILITGSSGTIGTRLFEILLNKGYEVFGIDKKENIWRKELNDRTIIGNLLDKRVFAKLPEQLDMVIHLAANTRVYEVTLKPDLAKENFEMTLNILEFCRKNNIKKFIFASSREIYGNNVARFPVNEEEFKIKNAESPYSASKIGGEALVYAYNKCFDIEFVIIRFSNVYGMYDDSDRVIPLFIKNTIEGKPLVIYGENKMLDFTYIDDAVKGIVKVIENFEHVKGEVFNIATGIGTYLVDIAKKIRKLLNGDNDIILEKPRKGEVVRYIGDISKAKEKLGYNPEVYIDEGLEKTIKWYLNNLYRR